MSSVSPAPSPILDGLADIFDLDPAAWAPRPAIYRIAYEYTSRTGPGITSRELFAILRARGFRDSKRKGVNGFVGIRVPESIASLPALVPEHSASSYRRGDRSTEARHARARQRGDRLSRAEQPDAPDRLATQARAEHRAREHRAWIADDLPRLKREARDLERVIASVHGGAGAPEHDRDAQALRSIRDQISSIHDRLRDA